MKTVFFFKTRIYESAFVLLGYLILSLVILVTGHNPIRVILATVLAFFGTGYSLSTVLFRKGDLDFIERIAFSFCLSLAIGGILGFFLARSMWGLRLVPLLIVTISFNFLCYRIACFQNRNSKMELPSVSIPVKHVIDWWKGQTIFEKTISMILLLLLVSGIFSFSGAFLAAKPDTPMTEFYLLDSAGLAENYPLAAQNGEKLSLQYGIVNYEREPGNFEVYVQKDDAVIGMSQAFTLNPDESKEENILFQIPEDAAGKTKIYFNLLRDHKLYRSLYLWIDIKPRGES